jgi:hypothetical protein
VEVICLDLREGTGNSVGGVFSYACLSAISGQHLVCLEIM